MPRRIIGQQKKYERSKLLVQLTFYLNQRNIRAFSNRVFPEFFSDVNDSRKVDTEEIDIYVPGFRPGVVFIGGRSYQRKEAIIQQTLGNNVSIFYVTDEHDFATSHHGVFKIEKGNDDELVICTEAIAQYFKSCNNCLYQSVKNSITTLSRDDSINEYHNSLERAIPAIQRSNDNLESDKFKLERDLQEIKQQLKTLQLNAHECNNPDQKDDIADQINSLRDDKDLTILRIYDIDTKINENDNKIINYHRTVTEGNIPEKIADYESLEKQLFYLCLDNVNRERQSETKSRNNSDDISSSSIKELFNLFISISSIAPFAPYEDRYTLIRLFEKLISLWEDKHFDMSIVISGIILENALHSLKLTLKTPINPKFRAHKQKFRKAWEVLDDLVKYVIKEGGDKRLKESEVTLRKVMNERNSMAHAQGVLKPGYSFSFKEEEEALAVLKDLWHFIYSLFHLFHGYCFIMSSRGGKSTKESRCLT